MTIDDLYDLPQRHLFICPSTTMMADRKGPFIGLPIHRRNTKIPKLPTELWIEIISHLDLEDIWLHIRPCCLLFNAISVEIVHLHVRTRVNNLCSVHSGNSLSLTTPHFHWNEPPLTPTNSLFIAWTDLPDDQHPDIFLVPAEEIPTCFSLYLAREMSWTYTLRIVFARSEIGDDGVEKWTSKGGWEMYYGTVKGPMRRDITNERALKWRRVCPTRVVVPIVGLVRMLLLGPDQGY